MGGFRIGRKVGKKSFVSIGNSGSYFSTWFGGYRISKFTPYKKTTAHDVPKEYIPKYSKPNKPRELLEGEETYTEFKQRILEERRLAELQEAADKPKKDSISWFWIIFGLLGFAMILTKVIRMI